MPPPHAQARAERLCLGGGLRDRVASFLSRVRSNREPLRSLTQRQAEANVVEGSDRLARQNHRPLILVTADDGHYEYSVVATNK